MRQHVISEWLLNGFARDEKRGRVLAAYSKATDAIEEHVPSRFLAIVDDHPDDIELALGRIEGPAARAARRLVERATELPPGLCLLEGDSDPPDLGPDIVHSDLPPIEGMKLLVGTRQVASPSVDDRRALARFMALMYTRAPKVEAALNQVAIHYAKGVAQAMAGFGQAITPEIVAELREPLEGARWRGLHMADELGEALAAMDWWLVRTGDDEAFVLGDAPVAATLALGHDDSWRPLLSPATYVIAMPLSTSVTLMIAPQRMMPITVDDPTRLVPVLNRLFWRWAGNHVLAPDEAALSRVISELSPEVRRSHVPIEINYDAPRYLAIRDVCLVLIEATWQRWAHCQLIFGRPTPNLSLTNSLRAEATPKAKAWALSPSSKLTRKR